MSHPSLVFPPLRIRLSFQGPFPHLYATVHYNTAFDLPFGGLALCSREVSEAGTRVFSQTFFFRLEWIGENGDGEILFIFPWEKQGRGRYGRKEEGRVVPGVGECFNFRPESAFNGMDSLLHAQKKSLSSHRPTISHAIQYMQFYRDLLNVIPKQGLKTFAREPKTSSQWTIQKNYIVPLDHKRLDIRYIFVLEPKFLILTPKRPIM